MPKVSVIMPSYNHAAFVREAVDSVLAQSYQDFELVITDDGSRDGTADIIRGMKDPRLRFHALDQNRGACVAANDAINRAQGEYCALLNSDDYFLPGKLQLQVEFLDAHPAIGAVFGQPRFVDERGRRIKQSKHFIGKTFAGENRSRQEWLRHFFYVGNALCHPTVMLRKSCYEQAGLFDPLLMQLPDLDMWVRICREFEIHILPDELTAFRILDRERNVSAPTREKAARHAWEMAAILERYVDLPDADLEKIFREAAGNHPSLGVRPLLALEAIRLERPGYTQFGLALLRDCIREDSQSFSIGQYFKLVGEHDPYAVQFSGREHRYLARSGQWHVVKRLSRILRPRRSHD